MGRAEGELVDLPTVTFTSLLEGLGGTNEGKILGSCSLLSTAEGKPCVLLKRVYLNSCSTFSIEAI
jgi:hypothetical protein